LRGGASEVDGAAVARLRESAEWGRGEVLGVRAQRGPASRPTPRAPRPAPRAAQPPLQPDPQGSTGRRSLPGAWEGRFSAPSGLQPCPALGRPQWDRSPEKRPLSDGGGAHTAAARVRESRARASGTGDRQPGPARGGPGMQSFGHRHCAPSGIAGGGVDSHLGTL
jgi:hypothetical protein